MKASKSSPFASMILRMAASLGAESRFGSSKVYISDIIATVRPYDVAAFKAELVAAHCTGHLELSRADMVAAMPSDKVRQSEVAHLNATFHFVRVA